MSGGFEQRNPIRQKESGSAGQKQSDGMSPGGPPGLGIPFVSLIRSLRHERRSNQRGLFPISASKLFAPGTVFVHLAIGDGKRLIGFIVPAVIPLRDGDVLAAPLNMAHQDRLRVADPVTKRKIREYFAETAVFRREVAFPFRFDILILFCDGGSAEADDQGDEEKGYAFHVFRNGHPYSEEKQGISSGKSLRMEAKCKNRSFCALYGRRGVKKPFPRLRFPLPHARGEQFQLQGKCRETLRSTKFS